MTSSPASFGDIPSTDRILQSALELFSQKGYDATSVREICAAAGITKPTLYHFFGSKEGVYRALVDDALEQFGAQLNEALEETGSTEARLRAFARAYFESGRSHPLLGRFILRLAHNTRSTAPSTDFSRFHEVVVAGVGRALERGVAEGELVPGPLDVRVLILLGALGQALREHLLLGRTVLSDTLADALVDNVLSGWRPVR